MKDTPEIKPENTAKDGPDPPKRPWLMYILTFFSQLAFVNQGYNMGATSGAVMLAGNVEYLHLNRVWKEVIMSGSMPGATASSLIGAYFSDRFGRLKCLILSCFCYVLGAIISGSAYNRVTLLIGRLLIGCGMGTASSSVSVYVAECSPDHLRGRLIGISQPFLTIGILLGTLFSALFSYDKENGWRYIWGLEGVIAFTQFVGLLFLPESPRWYIKKRRKNEAEVSLSKIRNTKDVEEEIQMIETSFKEVHESFERTGGGNLFVRMLKTRSVRRALIVGCGIQLFAQLSGVNTVIYYSGMIIQMAGYDSVSSSLWNSVIVNCCSLLFSIIGVWLVDSAGRRILAIIGLLGLFVSSLFLATTFLLTDEYSPLVNTTDSSFNICSTYSRCDACTRDGACGFCYKNIPDVTSGACLPVSNTSHFISEVGACNSSKSLSKYSLKWAENNCPVSFSWIAVIGLGLYFMFYAPGMGPLPWTINAEVYPLWARSIANGIGSTVAWLCNLIVSVTFLSFVELIHIYGVFYVLASVAFIGAAFCFLFQPETKNLSLEKIEALFSSKKATVISCC